MAEGCRVSGINTVGQVWLRWPEMAKSSTSGFLPTVPVSYQSNQWWELLQSSIKPFSTGKGRKHEKLWLRLSTDAFATHLNQTLHCLGSIYETIHNSLLHKVVKARKYHYLTAARFGKSFVGISLWYIVTQHMELQDLFCLWPLQLLASEDLNFGWLHVTVHEK